MAEHSEKTLFEQALLASRLVDATQLVEVAQRLPADPPGIGEHSDQRLADRLVERGLLNAWQIEQLRAGRTKFTLGPYLIVDAIGKGGMGHLFKGRHELLDRIEAVKVLPKSRTTPRSIAGFQHEIRSQAQLEHPNLVRVSFAGQDGDTHFLVTEFVPGVDLRRLVRRSGALPIDQAAAVLVQVAGALDHAHRRGLVHRDVKPGNLLVRPDGVVKVTDLGLAWSLQDSYGAAAGQGKIVGTCDYLAPESINSPDKIIPVSDIYSLGCTLYYAVTGKVPFPGGNAASKMKRQLEQAPIDPRSFDATIPDAMAELIAEMMQKDHRQRVPSAAAVADRLRGFVRDDSVAAVAAAVDHCAQMPSSARPPRAEGPGAESDGGLDIGETMVSLSDEALPFILETTREAPGDASQGTDPIAGPAHETADYGRPRGGAVKPPESFDGQASPSAQAYPSAEPAPPTQHVRLIASAAMGATAAIVIAAVLRFV